MQACWLSRLALQPQLLIITRSSSTLVGVMVAAALLPPTCAIGLLLGVGRFQEAIGAATLLAINAAALNLAADG